MTPRVFAHRGASGVAFENSMTAFLLARELGADGVELDVHATADGVLVVHHDPVLPGGRPIRELSAQAIRARRLPNDEPIPTLEEVIEALPDLDVWIEVKAMPPGHDQTLLDLIARAPRPERLAVHSFDHRLIARLHAKDPGLRLGILSTAYLLEPVRALEQTGAGTLWQEWSLLDAELVGTVHAAGRGIIAWTVNEASVAGTLRALGVDGLCGNWPDRLR